MGKPRLAFIDHSFHKKSRSADFLREIFREKFQVHNFWDESWNGGSGVPAEVINEFNFVFYFQTINPPEKLWQIKIPILWAPMYDGVKFDRFYWQTISLLPNIKILSFSQKLSGWLSNFDIEVLSAQFYFRPQAHTMQSGNHFFFWYRGDIKFKDLKKIIGPESVDSFTYLSIPDPRMEKEALTKEDLETYKIKSISSDFLGQKEYLEFVKQANIFVCPRKKEGIGMSFLEALSLGECVIGYNDSTLNEYITNKENGYLFDEKTDNIDLSDINKVRRASVEKTRAGYENWIRQIELIVSFMETPPSKKFYRLLFFVRLTLIRFYRLYLKVKYFLKNRV